MYVLQQNNQSNGPSPTIPVTLFFSITQPSSIDMILLFVVMSGEKASVEALSRCIFLLKLQVD